MDEGLENSQRMFPPSPSGKRPALSEDLEKVIFKKASPKAIIPLKATSGSIGYDLFSLDSYVVKPHKPCKINTGIAVSFPKGVYGRIAGRSGLAAKNNIIVMGGVIDPDFDGTIKVILRNLSEYAPLVVHPGDRIAQLILERAWDGPVEEGDYTSVEPYRHRGFGSTGIKESEIPKEIRDD